MLNMLVNYTPTSAGTVMAGLVYLQAGTWGTDSQ